MITTLINISPSPELSMWSHVPTNHKKRQIAIHVFAKIDRQLFMCFWCRRQPLCSLVLKGMVMLTTQLYYVKNLFSFTIPYRRRNENKHHNFVYTTLKVLPTWQHFPYRLELPLHTNKSQVKVAQRLNNVGTLLFNFKRFDLLHIAFIPKVR